MFRFFWIFLGVIAAVTVIAVVLNAIFLPRYYPASSYSYPYGMMYGMGWGFGPFWGFGALMMLIPLVFLIMFIFWIVGVSRDHNEMGHFNSHEKNALDILNERYANGSITREEYTKMKEEILRK
ncbi:MAG: SHOCT domain-containing protein [Thermoplasmatales archaeon]